MGLVQKGTLEVFSIRMPRETERHQRKERRTQEYPASNQPLITSEGEKVKSKHPLLYRREQDRLTWKAQQVERPVLRPELKLLVYGGARCRKSSCDYRHPPVCRSYKSGNRCICSIRCLFRQADGEEKPSKRAKSESTQGAVAILKEKKGPRLCISKIQIQRSLFCGKLENRDWTLRRDTPWNSQDGPGTKLKFGKEKGNL